MKKLLSHLVRDLKIIASKGDHDLTVSGIAYDSRKVRQGFIFVALPGTRQDGNAFIDEAVRNGAVSIITDKPIPESYAGSALQVEDSRAALAALAIRFYDDPSKQLKLIGVTGTNGKTTSVLLLESILKANGCAVGVIGTLGYRWPHGHQNGSMTTPESLDLQDLFSRMVNSGVTHAVMEVSSHAIAMKRVQGCTYGAAVFTNLSQDHLDFHGDMKDYFETKSLLFKSGMINRGEGFVNIINLDDPYGYRLQRETLGDVWSYSAKYSHAQVWVKDARMDPSGITATLATPCGEFSVRSRLIGRLNLYNILAAATCAAALGVPQKAIREGIELLKAVDGRLQKVGIPEEFGFDVIVDYAHTPDAMEKALSCVKDMVSGRLIVVFGCGGDRDRTKRPLMGEVACRFADLIILTSDNPRTEDPTRIIQDIEIGIRGEGLLRFDPACGIIREKGYIVEPERMQAIKLALLHARSGDMVFIGGKGHETYQIIGTKTLPFDDREAVRRCLQEFEHVRKNLAK